MLPESGLVLALYHVAMRDPIVLLVHLITTVLRIARPGGVRSVVAESVLSNHQPASGNGP